MCPSPRSGGLTTPFSYSPLSEGLPATAPSAPRSLRLEPGSRFRSGWGLIHLPSVNMAARRCGRAGGGTPLSPGLALRGRLFGGGRTHVWRPGRWAGLGRADRGWAGTQRLGRVASGWEGTRRGGEERRGEGRNGPASRVGAREDRRCRRRGGSGPATSRVEGRREARK